MAVSEAQKRAIAKWDVANMATLSCRVRKTTANAFHELCASRGTSVHAAIVAFVNQQLAAEQEEVCS